MFICETKDCTAKEGENVNCRQIKKKILTKVCDEIKRENVMLWMKEKKTSGSE